PRKPRPCWVSWGHKTVIETYLTATLRPILHQLTCLTNIRSEPHKCIIFHVKLTMPNAGIQIDAHGCPPCKGAPATVAFPGVSLSPISGDKALRRTIQCPRPVGRAGPAQRRQWSGRSAPLYARPTP